MSARLAALVAVVLFLRWLAVGHVTVTVAGITATVPALAVASAAVVAVAAVAIALLVCRALAEGAVLAAWRDGGAS